MVLGLAVRPYAPVFESSVLWYWDSLSVRMHLSLNLNNSSLMYSALHVERSKISFANDSMASAVSTPLGETLDTSFPPICIHITSGSSRQIWGTIFRTVSTLVPLLATKLI